MKIIFIGRKTAKPKSISLISLILFVIILFCLNFYLINHFYEKKGLTGSENLNTFKVSEDSISYRQNLNVYINQIGELYSRILGIDQQTERLQEVMKKQILDKEKLPKLEKKHRLDSKGGPLTRQIVSYNGIQKTLVLLIENIEAREEVYNRMEAMLLKQSVLRETLPSLYPVAMPYNSSSYGWRMHPILGKRAFHEGIDFSAAHGEPIYATAGGMVVKAGWAGAYGNLVSINHGGGLQTRYAHISKILVKKGDIVKKEDLIAYVGNTGRSTGPHLHYEIRLKNRSLDPKQYLRR
jgi:murein DD-endopeptidase MepM/ murein hydrolase activator NlpD|tara:strand:- start:2885 stop:3769 length:885 start_codon:yes stop_codon:yes gene_type:complete